MSHDLKLKVAKGDAIRFVLDRVAPAGGAKQGQKTEGAKGISVQLNLQGMEATGGSSVGLEYANTPDCDILCWMPRLVYDASGWSKPAPKGVRTPLRRG